MATSVLATGFEYGVTPTINGGGLCSTLNGTAGTSYVIESGIKHTGNYSLKIVQTTTTRACIAWTIASTNLVVARFYIYIGVDATGISDIFHCAAAAGSYMILCIDPSDHKFKIGRTGTTTPITTGPSYTTGQWYQVDVKVDLANNPNWMYCKIDNGTEFSGSFGQAGTTTTSVRLGNAGSSTNNNFTAYYDDFVVSVTSGDYPLGPGGTQLLKPNADGTHSIAANSLEDLNGNDINGTTVTAFNLINSIPVDSSAYIRCNVASSTSYAEVTFEDITDTHSAILCACGYLAYTSATTSSNNGATIMSKDSFATNTPILGTPASPADMSDGSLTDLWYKTAKIAGVVDDTTVNALKARLGYSADATPDPYWVDLWVEVAYTTSNAYTLTAIVQTYTETGVDLTAQLWKRVLTTGVQTYTETGVSASLAKGRTLTATVQTYLASAINLSAILWKRVIATSVQTYTQTGVSPNLLKGYKLLADVQTYTETGVDTNLTRGLRLSSAIQTYSEQGIDANLVYTSAKILQADVQSYAEIGINTGLLHNYRLSTAVQSYTETGIDAGVLHSRVLSAGIQSYVETGISPTPIRTYVMPTSSQTYVETGISISEYWKRVLQASVQGYVETGIDSTLTYGQVGHYTLTAIVQSYSESGVSVTLPRTWVVSTAVQTYSETGIDISLRKGLGLLGQVGTFTETAPDISTVYNRVLTPDIQTFTVSGIDVVINKGRRLISDVQSYVSSGVDILVGYNRVLSAAVQDYLETGLDANLHFGQLLTLVAEVQNYLITGNSANLKFGVINKIVHYTSLRGSRPVVISLTGEKDGEIHLHGSHPNIDALIGKR